MVNRAVPNIKSDRPAETREFFVDLLGFEVAMDLGWVVTVASPTNRSAQVTVIGNDDPAAPGISVEVADVDAVHARAVEKGFEIAYSLRDEEWGVRRFMLREPSGTLVQRRLPPLGLTAWVAIMLRAEPGLLRDKAVHELGDVMARELPLERPDRG
jgi:catechol 2,3-dioxygenase-like lactoylglutathione lyase family enzyme